MLIVLASAWNKSARAFASRFAQEGVRLLTPRGLSVAGWRHYVAASGHGVAVVEGEPIDPHEITAVLTQLPWVAERELTHIVPADRVYVAAEMSAFLLSWLSGLGFPVLNRPSTTCLCGPGWRRERWVQTAIEAGIPAQTVRRSASLTRSVVETQDATALTAVTVVGARTLGEGHPALHRNALRLASLARAELLSVHFSGAGPDAEFYDAHTFPDLGNPELASAILEHMCSPVGRPR